MDRDRRRDEALAWDELLKRDNSPANRAAYAQWLLDPDNAREAEQQVKYAEGLRNLGLRAEPVAPRRTGISWLPYALGASALGAAALAAVLAWPAGSQPAPKASAPAIASVDAPALGRAVRLADGSVALLSAGTTLGEPPAGTARGASLLSGSARFFVLHDPSRPFLVAANDMTVTARGTVFDVDVQRPGARVTLIEGQVDVARGAAHAPVRLAPHQSLASTDGSPVAAQPAVLYRATRIDADHLPLRDLVTVLNGQGGPQVVLAEADLAARVVTGKLDVADVRAASRRLAAALDLKASDQGDRIVLAAH